MKTEKYELYHQSNIIQIGNLIDDLHSVHVHLLLLQRRYYRIYGKYASFARICGHITKLKQRTKPHWNALPSQVIQDVAKRIHIGYEKFFDYLADKKQGRSVRKVGKPQIKPQHRYNSLTFTQAGYEIEDNRIHIKCLKKSFTFWKHREWTGRIKRVTLKRDNVGDYSLYLVCEDSDRTERLPLTSHAAGADFGMKTFLTLSDGIKIASPHKNRVKSWWKENAADAKPKIYRVAEYNAISYDRQTAESMQRKLAKKIRRQYEDWVVSMRGNYSKEKFEAEFNSWNIEKIIETLTTMRDQSFRIKVCERKFTDVIGYDAGFIGGLTIPIPPKIGDVGYVWHWNPDDVTVRYGFLWTSTDLDKEIIEFLDKYPLEDMEDSDILRRAIEEALKD